MVEIEGDFETSVCLPCSRCLRLFETHLKSHFSLTYMRRESEWGEDSEPQEVELNAEDIGMIYFQGDKIDLIDTIQEQVLMEFPLRVLHLEFYIYGWGLLICVLYHRLGKGGHA